MKNTLCSFVLMLFSYCLQAEIRLPQIIRDSMILQRDQPVRIWGWSSPKEKITVSFNRKTIRTQGNAEGRWMIELPSTKAGGPYTISFKGNNTIVLKEILFGDVWFCSGQSNMVHQLNIHDVTYADEIAKANNQQIRQFWIPTGTKLDGLAEDLPSGYWKSAVGEDIRPFSAVAYFFAKSLFTKYGVPIGIINASVGGTPIESWTGGTIHPPGGLARTGETQLSGHTARPTAPPDKGLSGPLPWYDPAYMPIGWRSIYVPGYWEDQGVKDFNGVIWYRKEITIPASMTGKAARIFLGRIVDAEEVYLNGKKIGQTTYLYPQRRYAVPADVLVPGKNLLVVRITNNSGKGGFVPDKPYYLFSGKDTVNLFGPWEYKVGAVHIPRPPAYGYGGNEQNKPSALYNAMVAPVTNYTIKGFCWYQGESNAGKPQEYLELSKKQVTQWRNAWKQGELPFLYVQLPGFMEYNYLPSESNWALMREAQEQLLEVPNTAMAIAIDLGEWNDIHPDNKKEVGDRLALAAMKLAYGEDLVYSGPLVSSVRLDSRKENEVARVVIEFDQLGEGLITIDGEPPAEFAIAGEDKKFYWAQTRLEGNTVIAWCPEVTVPAYIRYAHADNPVQPNLYNRSGLPASPFTRPVPPVG
jgi:sialate O-acetylesterase